MATTARSHGSGPAPDGQRYRLHGVERALDTLEILAQAGPGGLTLTRLAERIGVSRSTAFALLQTLVARGFVADSGTRLNRRYRLGMALATLGDAAEAQSPLIGVALPVVQAFADATGLATQLTIRDGAIVSVAIEVGLPVLAGRPVTDPAVLVRELELSKARGYTIDAEDGTDGAFCVGAAVYDRTGGCVAAISGTGLQRKRATGRVDELGVTIRDAADRITVALGGPPFVVRCAARSRP